MDIGVFIFDTDYSIRADELARELEDRGFESLFVPEHTHIPTSRKSPFPGGGPLPKQYSHTLDPFVTLSWAAAVTSRLRIGTGICLVPQRDPIVTAKSIASLDMMSNGRFVFGMGGGWNVEEMEDHGATYRTRFAMLREHVLAMKALWGEDEASFSGEHVSFEPTWSWPKPAQQPHPPLLLGGESDHTLRRVVEYCDGWFPRGRGGFDPAVGMDRLRRTADAAGRDMASLTVSVFGAPADAQTLENYAQAGIDRAILPLPSEGRDQVLSLLDRYGALLG
ncbi:MAG: LLM class F420-dependent oxidoreductase [Alphaproteobacteria bacterium]|nr:LLM class F420-dependent oxidoreductase [Alphaproteobacteria bacterium]